jgi:hypothetical protein
MSEKQAPDNTHSLEDSMRLFNQYVRDRLTLVKMETAEKTAQVTSLVVIFVIATMLAFFVLFFLSLMAGYYFAELTGSLVMGFGIVALIYVLFLVLLMVMRKGVIVPSISNKVIRGFFKQELTEPESHENN